MNLLSIEYLPEHNLHIVIPIIGRFEDPCREFLFEEIEDVHAFVTYWHQNAFAAEVGYYMVQQARG